MADDTQPTAQEPKKSKGLPLIAIIGIGCIGLIVLSSIIIGLAGSFLFSKIGLGMAKKAIEQKTGVSVDTGTEGMTITDKKSGTEVNLGAQKIPDDFPKDFPIYPGAKASGSMSGTNENITSGFWVVLTTPDGLEKVGEYYDSELVKNGWKTTNTMSVANSKILTLDNGTYAGTLSLSSDENKQETSIVIALGSKEPTATTE